MLFEKPSTRTRVSFQVGMQQLGGQVVVLSPDSMQLGRGETIADTARVLSRYVDVIMLRTSGAEKLEELARHATVPVINGLTDESHPCQIMADIMTYEERKGAHQGCGRGVVGRWEQRRDQLDPCRRSVRLRTAPCMSQRRLPPSSQRPWRGRATKGARVSVGADPVAAVRGADCIVTDTWVSMGDAAGGRHEMLAPFQVNESLMRAAKPDAIFMHCLPAHRGEEVTEGVFDSPQSVVWDEAENRLHAQKGVLLWCLT